MNCADFSRWLDEGMPHDARADADVHAAGCAACARQLEAEREVEALLERRFATAPTAFTNQVMARIPARVEPDLHVPELEPLFPWWIRVLQEPVTALSLVAAALLAATAPSLWASAHALLPDAVHLVGSGMSRLGLATSSPTIFLITTAAMLLLALASPLLWRHFSGLAGTNGAAR